MKSQHQGYGHGHLQQSLQPQQSSNAVPIYSNGVRVLYVIGNRFIVSQVEARTSLSTSSSSSSARQPYRQLEALFAADDRQRQGCLIYSYDDLSHGTFSTYICIALDYPLNTKPSQREVELSDILFVPGKGRQLLNIPTTAIGKFISIERVGNLDVESLPLSFCPPGTMLFCQGCCCVNQRKNMIMTCDRGHLTCSKHLLPWKDGDDFKEDESGPDLTTMQAHVADFLQCARESNLYDRYVKTRAVMSYYAMNSVRSRQERSIAMQNSLRNNEWQCDFCFRYRQNQYPDKAESTVRSIMTIEKLHEQLSYFSPSEMEIEGFSTGSERANGTTVNQGEREIALGHVEVAMPGPGRSEDSENSPVEAEEELSYPASTTLTQSPISTDQKEAIHDPSSHPVSTSDKIIKENINSSNNDDECAVESNGSGASASSNFGLSEAVFRSLKVKGYTPAQIGSAVKGLDSQDLDVNFISTLIDSSSLSKQQSQTEPQLKIVGIVNRGNIDMPASTTSSSYGRRDASPSHAVVVEKVILQRSILVAIRSPAMVDKRTVLLSSGTTYEDILQLAEQRQDDGKGSPKEELLIYRVDKSGWSQELRYQLHTNAIATYTVMSAQPVATAGGNGYYSSQSADDAILVGKSFIDLTELEPNDTLVVRRPRDNISARFMLGTLAENFRYNQHMQRKVSQLSLAYEGWRPIRGDGNCYYRAICYGLLEQLVLRGGERARLFRVVKGRFENILVHPEDADPERDAHERLLSLLERASNGGDWRSVSELERSFCDPVIDSALVRACRGLVAHFVLSNEEVELNGLSIRDSILPSHPECRDLKDYCDEYILKMGVDAEGTFVYLGLLLIALGCSGSIILLDQRQDVEINEIKTEFNGEVYRQLAANRMRKQQAAQNSENDDDQSHHIGFEDINESSLGKVTVLLRPGHYDLLYPRGTFASCVRTSCTFVVEDQPPVKVTRVLSIPELNAYRTLRSRGVMSLSRDLRKRIQLLYKDNKKQSNAACEELLVDMITMEYLSSSVANTVSMEYYPDDTDTSLDISVSAEKPSTSSSFLSSVMCFGSYLFPSNKSPS